MSNSKQKPVPEGAKRSPGKSKFSIPRKEAPPIDGSYLDRLFADYEKQTREGEGAVESAQVESQPQPVARQQKLETSQETAAVGPSVEVSRPTTPPQLVSAPVEVEELHESEITLAYTSPPETTQYIADAPVTETPEESVPEPAPKPPLDEDEFLQKLVKLHRLSKGEAGILRVMMRLCQERDSDTCYIKIPQLMAITGLKDRQTQRILKSLSELHLIERLAEYSNADRLGIKYRVILSRA